MLGLLKRCFPDRIAEWEPELRRLIPSYGQQLNPQPALADEVLTATASALSINR